MVPLKYKKLRYVGGSALMFCSFVSKLFMQAFIKALIFTIAKEYVVIVIFH